jgi:16S rRNA (cytosine967-C5)-methyltransferase
MTESRRSSPPSPEPSSGGAARGAALRLLLDLEESAVPATGRMEQTEGSLSESADRAFFRTLVLETLRHRARLDHLLNGWLDRRPLSALPPPIRNALRLGAVQLLVLDGIPPHAAVHETVELAAAHGHRGTTGLVNAVLRRAAREGRARWEALDQERRAPTAVNLSLRYSHPDWLVRRWMSRWGAERTEAVLSWNNRHPDYWLRLRPGAAVPDGAEAGWVPGSARMPAGSRPAREAGFARGDYTVQDGSGILIGSLCEPVRGTVLDLCAAPGTKTGHLLERAEPGARVVALDLSPGRLKRLVRGLGRWPTAASALVVAADSTRVPVRGPWHGILLDAPCSNLGVLRRRVDLKWRAREEEIDRLAVLQARLLDAAAEGAAPGAWLVYSVCTTEPEETERQRDRFFDAHPGWRPRELPGSVPAAARGREGEMALVPGELETDGGYAFVARRSEAT